MYKPVVEYVSLVATVLSIIHYYYYSNKKIGSVILFFFGAIFIGTLSEAVTILTTNSYDYVGFSFYIGPVPLFITIGWCNSFYFTWHISNQITFKLKDKKFFYVANAITAGIAGVLIDLYFDPVAVSLDWWQWKNGSAYFNVPVINFIGWFIFCGGYAPIYNYFNKKDLSGLKKTALFILSLVGLFIVTAVCTLPFLKS